MSVAKKSGAVWVSTAALCAALVGCGGGEATGSAVTGVALSDAPIAGTVSLNDSSPQVQQRTVATRPDGSFSFDVAGLTPPYQLRVEWDDSGTASKLYSVTEGNASLDVNPITDVAFVAASGDRDSDDVFEQSMPDEKRETARRARNSLDQLQSVLAPLFELYGISDPIIDKEAVRALLADVRIRRDGEIVTVTNRETGAVIFSGPIDDLASGTFYPENMPAGPGTPTDPTICTDFTYSAWGACQPDGTQTRTVVSSSPAGCTGGDPALMQSCTYVPPVTACTSFTYSAWGTCQPDGTQTRTVLSATPAGCTGGDPTLTRSCTYVPPVTTCTSFTYSAWGTCQPDGTQTRTVLSSSPAGCTGGDPTLTRSCTYTPPACTYTYSAWSTCDASGTQTRTVLSSSPEGCVGTPVLSQACTPPTASCGTCHGIPPSTGRHSRHNSFASCGTCHGSGYSSTTTNSATHMNGTVNVTTTIGWDATTRSCANACHGSRSW